MTYSRKSFSGHAAATTLTAGIGAADTVIAVGATTGFPNTATGPFIVTIDRGTTTEEKIEIASYTSTSLNVSTGGRGWDGTTAQAHSTNASLVHSFDADTIDKHETFVAGNGTVVGSTSAVGDVATTGTSAVPAAADHKHARESFAVSATTASAPGDASSDGVSVSPARADHKHAREAAPAVQVPVGGMVMWPGPGSTVPANFALAQGQAVSRTTYAAVYTALGAGSSPWGQGDGSTTFNLPNLMDSFPVGAGNTYAVGASGGAVSTVLTTGMIPAFTPTISISDPGHNHTGNTGNNSVDHTHQTPADMTVWNIASTEYANPNGGSGIPIAATTPQTTSGQNATHVHAITTGSTGVTATCSTFGSGSPTAVPTLPPYKAINWIVRMS